MKHDISYEAKSAPIRWGVVVRVVLAVAVVAFIAGAVLVCRPDRRPKAGERSSDAPAQ